MGNRFSLIVLSFFLALPAHGEAPPLTWIQTISLPGVEGRIDHFSIDVQMQRLFVAALGNNTVEVIDLKVGRRIHTITGFHEPQGVLFIGGKNKLFVANEKNGVVDIFDGTTFERTGSVKFPKDADNMRYDASHETLYVGYGEGGLGVMDVNTMEHTGGIQLGSHPESFQMGLSGKIFVNLPPTKVAVIDKKNGNDVTTWSLLENGVAENFPMDLDEVHHRLFVGTRLPAKLIVLDSESGKLVGKIPTVNDPDDIFYDAARKRIYVSGGGGSISIFAQLDADHYRLITDLATAAGARTSLFVPELDRLYLGVPPRDDHPAEIRVYQVNP